MTTPITDDVLRALATLGGTATSLMMLKGQLVADGFSEPGISNAIEDARSAGIITMDWRGTIART